MPTTDDLSPWRRLAGQAERICEAARHDPYEPRLAEEMQALAAQLTAVNAVGPAGSATLDAAGLELRAAAHAAAAEAWFALNDSPQALAQFDTALAMLGPECRRSPGSAAVAAQAQYGRGKCLVDLQRSAEAIPVLDASIGWYTAQGDPTDEAQQSLLSQALHTLGLAHGDAGDHARALEATARAVALRRRLAEHDVGRYRLALSRSLRNLGNWLNELGRRDEALQSRREMLELRREQSRREPSTAATLALAQGADALARELVDTERDLDDALALAQESAALYLQLDRTCQNRFATAFERQIDLLIALTDRLANSGMRDKSLQMAEGALDLLRAYRSDLRSFAPGLGTTQARLGNLSKSLSKLGIRLHRLGQRQEALAAAEEGLHLLRSLARANPPAFAPDLAKCLDNLGIYLGELGRRGEALAAAEEALQLNRALALSNAEAFTPALATNLNNLGVQLSELGRLEEALAAAQEALELHRALARAKPHAFTPDLARSLSNLVIRLSRLGRREEGLVVAEEAANVYRDLARANPRAYAPDLAMSLTSLSVRLSEVGRREDAIVSAEESLGLYRELARANPQGFAPGLANCLGNLAIRLSELGQHEEALVTAEEALEFHRALARDDPRAFMPNLAMSLNNLGIMLSERGRLEEALIATEEAVKLRRALVRENPQAFNADLAHSLDNLGIWLSELGRVQEAVVVSEEALQLLRALAGANPQGFAPDLSKNLCNLALRLGDLGQWEQAIAAIEEGLELLRNLAQASPRAFMPTLAKNLDNRGVLLSVLGRHEAALAATAEAVELHRALANESPRVFTRQLAMSLNNLGIRLGDLGRREEALADYRECASTLLELHPDDPHLWCRLCRGPVYSLDTPQDLRSFHLHLLGMLTEHRELAWNDVHAGVFLELQAQVALRVWGLLASLPIDEGKLLDEAVAALVATLQSPDLARWIEARGSGDGPLAKLAELKREVIEAEQRLAALRRGLSGGEGSGLRMGSFGPGTEEQRAALTSDVERQAAKAQALRHAFREERARLVAVDPRFAAAFEPVGAQALRSISGHAQGGALLCVLELGGDGAGQTELSSSEGSRCVAALLHADGCRTQLLELTGVHELAWHAQHYRPEALGVSRRGALRGAPAGATRSASDGAYSPPITDLLAPRVSESFWRPLQQALQASGVAIERLHVCLHCTTQQLPLALRQAGDCPGLQVTAWPGLPYLRRAAMAASAKAQNHAGTDASAPWLVGHDCAWASEQPLPMVAVEAALLRDLLQRHGESVQQIRLAAQLHGQASALVACCHGGAEQAQFDHALHLGTEPLTVRQIVQESIGPPLALLPACHAGRTDEDAAGNALGVAAAFMLSGTHVVIASSKAVPDLLQPWLSTVTVWHAMQGLPHHEAATLAREQFARLDFPEGYRSWLQQALPQALATIQPGGEEDEHIRGVHAQTALEQVEERWPWEGETKDLFSADTARREEARRSVVQGILRPRGGEAGALALAAEAREMAAFVFVYGVDGSSRS